MRRYYIQYFAPNGSFGDWLFSAVPDPTGIFTSCLGVFKDLGARTMSEMWGETTAALEFPVFSRQLAPQAGTAAPASFIYLSSPPPQGFSILGTSVIKDDLSNVTDAVRTTKELNADVLTGAQRNYTLA